MNIELVSEHDAGTDAAVTATCLVALLRVAPAAGLVSLDDFITRIGATTATLPAPSRGPAQSPNPHHRCPLSTRRPR